MNFLYIQLQNPPFLIHFHKISLSNGETQSSVDEKNTVKKTEIPLSKIQADFYPDNPYPQKADAEKSIGRYVLLL